MIETVLVPLDGSTLAEQALVVADQLARRSKARIVLVRAPNMEPAYATAESAYGLIYPEQAIGRASAEAKDYLKSVQSLQAARGLTVGTLVVEGDAAGAVVDVAGQIKADIITMSSHGYSGLTRWLLGSVAEKVLRAATCPVLVVRSRRSIKRILVPLDGSDLSERSVGPAIDVAQALEASVTLLRVVPEFHVEQLRDLDEYEYGLGPRLVEEMQADADSYLKRVSQPFAAQGLPIECEVRFGPAATSILTYAENHAIDLIAMATHGRSGLQRWVYGSVTEKVLRAGEYSMLVVRPQIHNLN